MIKHIEEIAGYVPPKGAEVKVGIEQKVQAMTEEELGAFIAAERALEELRSRQANRPATTATAWDLPEDELRLLRPELLIRK